MASPPLQRVPYAASRAALQASGAIGCTRADMAPHLTRVDMGAQQMTGCKPHVSVVTIPIIIIVTITTIIIVIGDPAAGAPG